MNPKTFLRAPRQALAPGRGGRCREAAPVPPAEAVAPETFPHAPQQAQTGTRMPEAPRSAGTDVADQVASVPPALECDYGNYPWDRWERKALAAGVPVELATLGRAVMREAYQHDWEARLKALCGWSDWGRCMIEQAVRMPAVMQQRWQRLLDTDGYRGERDPKTGEWKSWP